MNNFASFLFSLSILPPLLVGMIRFRKIHSSYLPFVLLIATAALTELLSFISIRLFRTNAIVSNVYCLAECLLILYQFYRWRFHARMRAWYRIIPVLCLLVWITENLVFLEILTFGPVFRISYAFLVVMLSINEINYLITHENRHLFRNARFLICIGFIIYFLYQILFEGALFVADAESNTAISNKIISLSVYINVFVNGIYTAAMWVIPENMSDFEDFMQDIQQHDQQGRPRQS